jgi:hypothetical protein
MKNKLVPALIGGGAIAVVLLLLSLIPLVRNCSCVLAILGGALAAYLYVRKSAAPVSSGEGIIVGAMAGAVTSAIRVAYLSIIFLVNRENLESLSRDLEERMRPFGGDLNSNWVLFIVLAGVILAVVMLIVLEAIGGVIGVALFEKRKGETVPPPPPPQMPPDTNNLPGGAPGL